MRVEPVPGVALGPAPAVRQYVAGQGPVLERFPYHPFRSESFRARLRYLRETYATDRTALAAALVAENARIGAGPAALAAARRLAEPEAVAVVTGQQPGACTGPLYTIYKAVTAVHLARRQEDALGVPVVPVFWVGSEDHDFQEIAPVEFPAGDGWTRLVLDGQPPRRVSVGHLPAGPAVQDLLDRLEEALPATEFRAGVLARLRQAAGEAADLGDWFARLMAWLFRDTPLVFCNPLWPSVRRLEAPFFALALERYPEVDAALAAGLTAWQQLGFEPTVERQPGAVNLFAYAGGERVPLVGEGERIRGRDRPEVGGTVAELRARALADPAAFSTNVVTRPVAQGFLLPDLAYVGGPGEIQYMGVLREVFRVFGRELPPVYPRTSVTLVEPALARYLEKQGIGPRDVFGGLEARRREVLDRADRIRLGERFGELRERFYREYDALVETLVQLDPSLRPVAAENRRQIGFQLDRLQEKAAQALRKRCEVDLRQLDRLTAHLTPHGRLQERHANVVYFLVKYGPDLVARLVETLPLPEPWQHVAVYL